HYYLEAVPDNPCVSTRASHNTTRSNKSAPVSGSIVNEIPENFNVEVLVYPNPSTGNVYVNLDQRAFQTIELIDGTGKLCMSTGVSDNITELNLLSLERGVYILKIYGTDNVVTKKIILAK